MANSGGISNRSNPQQRLNRSQQQWHDILFPNADPDDTNVYRRNQDGTRPGLTAVNNHILQTQRNQRTYGSVEFHVIYHVITDGEDQTDWKKASSQYSGTIDGDSSDGAVPNRIRGFTSGAGSNSGSSWFRSLMDTNGPGWVNKDDFNIRGNRQDYWGHTRLEWDWRQNSPEGAILGDF